MSIANIFVKYIKLRSKLNESKIYKIIDNTNGNIYIGSTCQSLKRRLSHHKSDYKRFLKGLSGNTKSFDIIKNNDYKIELIEACDIKTKQELFQKERYYIENNDCLNKNIPCRSQKEYQENKNLIRQNENIIEGKMNDFQKQYIKLIGVFYNIINENYIKTDSKKDIIPLKDVYDIFKDNDIYIFSNYKHQRKLRYKYFIEKIKNNILFKKYLKQNNKDAYILTNLKINNK